MVLFYLIYGKQKTEENQMGKTKQTDKKIKTRERIKDRNKQTKRDISFLFSSIEACSNKKKIKITSASFFCEQMLTQKIVIMLRK